MRAPYRTFKAFMYMFHLLKKTRPKRLLTMPISIIFRAIQPFIPIVFPSLILDNLLNGSDLRIILVLIATMCLLEGIITFVLEIIGEKNLIDSAIFIFELTGMILNKYMELDMADLEDPNVFQKYSMANSALDMHVDNFIGLVEGIFIRIFELIGAAAIIITLHPVIILFVMIVTFLLSFIQKKRLTIEREFDEGAVGERRKYRYLYDTVNDFKYGKEIRTYGIKKNIIARVESINNTIYMKYKQSRKKSGTRQIWYNLLIFLQQTGIYGYLIFSFAVQAISVGSFYLYLGSIDRFKDALTSIGDVVVEMNYMGLRIYDVQNFMSIESKLQNTKKDAVGIWKCLGYGIRFVNVGFHYPNSEVMVLKNINITIPQGERLTIVGENGAGKSTFVKLLLRIYDPTEGDIYLGGVNIKDIPLEEYHSILATVFQDYKVLSFTVRENIIFGKASAVDDKKILRILDSLNMGNKVRSLAKGLDTYLNNDFEENGVQMSGGEMQK